MSALDNIRTLIMAAAAVSVGELEGTLDVAIEAYRRALAESDRISAIASLAAHAPTTLGPKLTAELLAVAIARLADRDELDAAADMAGGPR